MQQFAPLHRKDNQSVRYLVVDDSVFARKNLIKMIEMFGGEVAGEAGDGLTAIASSTAPSPTSCSWTSPCRRWKASKRSNASCVNTPTPVL